MADILDYDEGSKTQKFESGEVLIHEGLTLGRGVAADAIAGARQVSAPLHQRLALITVTGKWTVRLAGIRE